MRRNRKTGSLLLTLLLLLQLLLSGCGQTAQKSVLQPLSDIPQTAPVESMDSEISEPLSAVESTIETEPDLSGLPMFDGTNPYKIINDNQPDFTTEDITEEPFETYSDLDELGRCGAAFANICIDLMPTEERDAIGSVTPSGWQSVKYDFVDGGYLYNRCHLIGFQLAGENANKLNLITGTRYLNIEGMLPFENMIANYVKETENHVLYRVTPVFEGNNLVASGVYMEAYSVEDDGEGVCFHVYCFNVQPGVAIDYRTGESHTENHIWPPVPGGPNDATSENYETDYILNTSSMKFHLDNCPSIDKMSDENKERYYGRRDDLIDMGYDPCGVCCP